MSKILNDDNPLNSALKEGIVLGVVATLRQFELALTKENVGRVLRDQQGWSESEIQYFSDWLLFFSL